MPGFPPPGRHHDSRQREYGVPGADDEVIFADIVRSVGRDLGEVRKALATLRATSDGGFADMEPARAEIIAAALLNQDGPMVNALGRAVLQCYYRDDRVFRSIGREPRPPFPKGHVVEQGDWSLLDAVRGRPRMWRDVDGVGT